MVEIGGRVIQMSLWDILFCVALSFSPAVNCRAIVKNPYGIFLGIENDAQDYAVPKVHYAVLECSDEGGMYRENRAAVASIRFPTARGAHPVAGWQ